MFTVASTLHPISADKTLNMVQFYYPEEIHAGIPQPAGCGSCSFAYLPAEVVARVVEKFILQLELQLADREVHIARRGREGVAHCARL